MRAVAFLLLSFAALQSVARPPEGGPVHWQTIEDAEATSSSRPLLVYFGAEWCGPCKTLETVVFNQPDIQAALKPFRTVYIDGDAPGALASMERFDVKVFPSLVAIGADGKETARIVGSAEKREFARFLETATLAEGPTAMLDRLGRDVRLTAEQWKLLAQIDIHSVAAVRDGDEAGQDKRRMLRDKLAGAVAALDDGESTVDPATDASLRLKSLILDATSTQPETARAAHHASLDKMLADPMLSGQFEGLLLAYAEPILAYLEPSPAPSKRRLARALLDTVEAAYGRPDTSLPIKMEILALALPLLEAGSDDPSADKTRYAERAEEALKQATDPKSRLAIVTSVAALLGAAGHEFRKEAIVRETLRLAPDAYWLYVSLSRYAKQRGDLETSVVLAERGYRASISHIDALAYGPTWVQALVDRDPSQVQAIAAAADEVFGQASKSKDAFRSWHAEAWTRFAGTLSAWRATDTKARSEAVKDFARRLDTLCGEVKDDAASFDACRSARKALDESSPSNV